MDGKQQRGRPQRHPVDVLFARLWMFKLMALAQLTTPKDIQIAIEPDRVKRTSEGVRRSGSWDLYAKGLRIPTPTRGRPDPVEMAEARFPGSARYFKTPLRALLRDEPTTSNWVADQLRTLPPAIRRVLFVRQPAKSSEDYLAPFELEVAAALAAEGGFDGLSAAVLMMRWAELVPSTLARRAAWFAYMVIRQGIRDDPDIAPVADELFAMIDKRFPHWLYLAPDRRVEIVYVTYSLGRDRGVLGDFIALANFENTCFSLMSDATRSLNPSSAVPHFTITEVFMR